MSKQLETAAVAAHAAGQTWAQFWRAHADAIRALKPWDRLAYRRLVRKLLALVSAGDTDGMDPVGDGLPPWEIDNRPSPHDSVTQARCLLPMQQLPMRFTQEAST